MENSTPLCCVDIFIRSLIQLQIVDIPIHLLAILIESICLNQDQFERVSLTSTIFQALNSYDLHISRFIAQQ